MLGAGIRDITPLRLLSPCLFSPGSRLLRLMFSGCQGEPLLPVLEAISMTTEEAPEVTRPGVYAGSVDAALVSGYCSAPILWCVYGGYYML